MKQCIMIDGIEIQYTIVVICSKFAICAVEMTTEVDGVEATGAL